MVQRNTYALMLNENIYNTKNHYLLQIVILQTFLKYGVINHSVLNEDYLNSYNSKLFLITYINKGEKIRSKPPPNYSPKPIGILEQFLLKRLII